MDHETRITRNARVWTSHDGGADSTDLDHETRMGADFIRLHSDCANQRGAVVLEERHQATVER
jgi:hypothetical protein